MNNYEQVTPTSNGTRSNIGYTLFMIAAFVGGFLLVWLLVQLYFAR